MIKQAGRRILVEMRGWPSAAGRLSRRMRKRPEPPRSPWGRGGIGTARWHPGLAALAFAGAILAVAGILLYLRTRRQVTAHFRMGEGGAAREVGAADAFRAPETARPRMEAEAGRSVA